jgi:dimethylaniline monooxygenase (N-oxide forming) / hypotaurine monooxygenase
MHADKAALRRHVAVIGAGPAGLAAMKCLQEEGFLVTAFERRSDVGGLWRFSENPNFTSVTSSTKAQLSKFVVSPYLPVGFRRIVTGQ